MSAACSVLMDELFIGHCDPPIRGVGSPNVLVNGLPWSCQTHPNIVHSILVGNKCIAHQAILITGSPTVLINGLPAGRFGDPTCTAVAEGSPNVFCGFF